MNREEFPWNFDEYERKFIIFCSYCGLFAPLCCITKFSTEFFRVVFSSAHHIPSFYSTSLYLYIYKYMWYLSSASTASFDPFFLSGNRTGHTTQYPMLFFLFFVFFFFFISINLDADVYLISSLLASCVANARSPVIYIQECGYIAVVRPVWTNSHIRPYEQSECLWQS